MPRTIEIVEPFTSIKNFDKDPEPDGIELLIQAVNSLDNPGLMIVGTIRVELYQFVPSSAQRRGQWLDKWDISLTSPQDQRRYWNQATQMYQFELGIDPQIIPLAKRFVLSVTYNSPLGTRLTDECVVEYNQSSGPLGSS